MIIESKVMSLIVTNDTSEDKVVRLFDCNDLFNTKQDDGIKIENAFQGVSYKEILIQLLSGENKIEVKLIRMLGCFSELERDKDYLLMTLFCKNIYSHQFMRPICFKKSISQIPDDVIESYVSCLIYNGCYIEYTAKANTKVIISFINTIDDSLLNVNGVPK